MKRGIRIKVMRIGNTRYWFIRLWVPVWHAETMNVKNLRTTTGTVITFYCQKWTKRGCVSSCFVFVLLGQQQSAVCSQLEEDNHSIWRRNWGKFLYFISGYYTRPILHTPKVTKMTFYTGKIHQLVTNLSRQCFAMRDVTIWFFLQNEHERSFISCDTLNMLLHHLQYIQVTVAAHTSC